MATTVIAGFFYYKYVFAYSNPCGKMVCSYSVSGYFSGDSPATKGSLDAVLPNGSGDAIPSKYNTDDEFINYIKGKNDSSQSKHNRRGSAFLVCRMLEDDYDECQADGYISGYDITSAGWTEFSARVKNPAVTKNYGAYVKMNANFKNTAYDLDKKDVFIYTRGLDESGSAITFSFGGKTVFTILRHCGNPVGSLHGIPGSFTLKPTVEVNGVTSGYTAIEGGSSFPVIPSINNSSDVDSTTATATLVKTITNPNQAGATTSVSQVFDANSTVNVLDYTESNTDYTPGTRICFTLSIQPYSSSNTGTKTSSKPCVVITKKPKVQIWGGDLWVGRQFSGVSGGLAGTQTSQSEKGGNTFGSWVEYGIFATGEIDGTGSGSAFAGSGLASVASSCDYSTLSFANVPAGGTSCTGADNSIGNFSNSNSIPDISALYPVSGSTPAISGPVNIATLSERLYRATNDISLSAGVIPTGRTIIINASGRTVTITGDITYTNALLHGIRDIPQVVIIADKIVINSGVTNVDAWLIARNNSGTGEIDTCDQTTALTVNICNQRLTINGPVMTQKLVLARTAGSGTGNASGDPAEILNLRADAYLWALGQASNSGKIRTVYSLELPPRF
ncbi:MAG: hypothetical protein ACM3KH_00800 [Thiobacillus sp.]